MKENDEEGYDKALAELRELHRPYLETFSARAYEYGVMTLKNMMLVSGGALISIPAIVTMSDRVEVEIAMTAGAWFAATLLLCLLTSYIIHLNWQANFDAEELQLRKGAARAREKHLPLSDGAGKTQKDYEDEIRAKLQRIGKTYRLPHFLSFCAFVCFSAGIWQLFSSV